MFLHFQRALLCGNYKKKSSLRGLIESADYISSLGYNEVEEVDSIIDKAEKRF